MLEFDDDVPECGLGTLEKLFEMASANEPWGLFEPVIWKDKLTDLKWHCMLRNATGGALVHETGATFTEAIDRCYDMEMSFRLKN